MYRDLLNNEVVIIISTRTDIMCEFTGLLCEEDENLIKIKNCEFCSPLHHTYGRTIGLPVTNCIGETIINKNYIVACYKK